MAQFKALLYDTYRRMWFPVVWLPSVVLSIAPSVFTVYMANRGPLMDPGSLGWPVLFFVVSIPAIISGSAWAIKTLLERDLAGWTDFWQGLGKYYWRLVGAALLLVLCAFAALWPILKALSMAIEPYELMDPQNLFSTAFWGIGLVIFIVMLIARYFLSMWLASLAMEDTGILRAVRLSASFAWNNPKSLIPAFTFDVVTNLLLQQAGKATLNTPYLGYTIPELPLVFIVAAVSGIGQAYVRLMYFNLYRGRRTVGP